MLEEGFFPIYINVCWLYSVESHTEIDENRSKLFAFRIQKKSKRLVSEVLFWRSQVFYFRVLAKENGASVGQIVSGQSFPVMEYIKEQDPVHICDIVFMHFRFMIWRILEDSRVVLEQFVADLFITVSFGFWWVFCFLMEKSNWRRFNRASIQRCLNFLRVLLEIFHFNLLIQPVFRRGDDKNSVYSQVLELFA